MKFPTRNFATFIMMYIDAEMKVSGTFYRLLSYESKLSQTF